ncbi:AdeC/AdeK/OprM family multidrug efflux complex outer membrane factor [soil metagenome]
MRLALTLFASAALAGCTVGPDFQRPTPPNPENYRDAAEWQGPSANTPRATLGAGPQTRWWRTFGSAELDALVDRAMLHNQTLAASDATLAAVAHDARAIAGKRLPQVDINARIEREQANLATFGFSAQSLGLAGNPEFNLYSVGGGISYDLDLFGGVRRQVEQARAKTESQQRRTEAVHLTVAGQVVNQVLSIAGIRAQISTAETLLREDQRNLDLTQKRRQAGEGTLVEVLAAQSQYAADQADIPQLYQQLGEARHLLAVLVGVSPTDLGATDFDLNRLTLTSDIPVTLPSELVHKRPDILQTEADLHAATAEIGVATARMYPDISLGATLSQAGSAIGDLVTNSFRGYDLFGGLTAPIFHGGTLKAQRAAAISRAQAAAATYQQTVLEAFQQVADLLSALQNDTQSVATQTQSVSVAQRSLQLSRRSFQVGNSGILQVLDSERLYQRATSNLVLARSRQYLNVARLYVATAGGWTS